ncbi:hypothetical protein AC1031_006258 [Aphanomyces cochlioides]|nr:hypothetical protein AC1031_006258 [Aphanomyces cochlioides]
MSNLGQNNILILNMIEDFQWEANPQLDASKVNMSGLTYDRLAVQAWMVDASNPSREWSTPAALVSKPLKFCWLVELTRLNHTTCSDHERQPAQMYSANDNSHI